MKLFLVLLVSSFLLMGCGGGNGSPGEAGATGSTGPAGSNGSNGTNGEGLTVTTKLDCTVYDTGSGPTLEYTYSMIQFSNGVKLITCSIADSTGTYSGSKYYTLGESGSDINQCLVYYNASWTFEFDESIEAASARKSGYTYTFVSGACDYDI